MPSSSIATFACALAFALGACVPALAADCNGRQSAGYRVLISESMTCPI